MPPAPLPLGTWERSQSLDVLQIRAADLHVWSSPTGNGSAPTTAALVREALRARGVPVYAVIDGPMFSTCAGDPGRRSGETEVAWYRRATCGRVGYRLLDPASGVDIQPTAAHVAVGATISVVDGRFRGASGSTVAPGATVAVQGYPPLVERGVSVARNVGSNAETTYRVALVMLTEDVGAFAIGRSDMEGFAARLVRMGAVWATYLDGGGSARGLDRNGAYKGSSENRRVPSFLYAAGTGNEVIVTGPDGNAIGGGVVPIQPGPGRTLGGAAVGAAIGGAFGGPIGAIFGAVIGFAAAGSTQ